MVFWSDIRGWGDLSFARWHRASWGNINRLWGRCYAVWSCCVLLCYDLLSAVRIQHRRKSLPTKDIPGNDMLMDMILDTRLLIESVHVQRLSMKGARIRRGHGIGKYDIATVLLTELERRLESYWPGEQVAQWANSERLICRCRWWHSRKTWECGNIVPYLVYLDNGHPWFPFLTPPGSPWNLPFGARSITWPSRASILGGATTEDPTRVKFQVPSFGRSPWREKWFPTGFVNGARDAGVALRNVSRVLYFIGRIVAHLHQHLAHNVHAFKRSTLTYWAVGLANDHLVGLLSFILIPLWHFWLSTSNDHIHIFPRTPPCCYLKDWYWLRSSNP